MPSALTYPGVYVEEIPSGVRTITGVATSITAFIGRAQRGTTDVATTINSFADFERIFGGLWASSSLGFAVRDFFLNGGSQAIVIRLYKASPAPGGGAPAPASSAPLAVGNLNFVAVSQGKWGVGLRMAVDQDNIPADVAKSLGLTAADLFNLTVVDTNTGASERYLNVSLKNSSRRVDKVLLSSDLIRFSGIPDGSAAPPAGQQDALGTKEKALADAKKALVAKQNTDPGNTATEAAAVKTKQGELDTALTNASAAVSDGDWLTVNEFLPANGQLNKKGLYALEQADLFNLLCLPPYRNPTDSIDVDPNLISEAAVYCEMRRALLLVESPKNWTTKQAAREGFLDNSTDNVGTRSRNAALYFPRLNEVNPLHDNRLEIFAACGAVAGVYARTDSQRGVWKAPAGMDATIVGAPSLSVPMTDAENGELNPLGVNCLRSFPFAGRVVWGARTLRGADQLADEYKYVPVRRTALYIEESLYRGLKWVVFEPNDEPLWAQIRLNAGAFMHNLFRQHAFQGSSPRDAYFVKCDKETTTQNDIDLGIVNVVVGFAPLKPAEFVVIKLQQIAGQIEV